MLSPRREYCQKHQSEFERGGPCLLCLSERLTGRQARTAVQILRRPLPFLDGALTHAPGLAIRADEHDHVSNTIALFAGVGDAAARPVGDRDRAVGARGQA